jgi:hypothetical protein
MISDVYARHLGIDLNECPVEPVRGIAGTVLGHLAVLDIRLCGQWFEVPVVFTPNRWPQLLGREGVFDNLFVGFAYEGLGVNAYVAMGRP